MHLGLDHFAKIILNKIYKTSLGILNAIHSHPIFTKNFLKTSGFLDKICLQFSVEPLPNSLIDSIYNRFRGKNVK